jgi:hypothetical protein
MATVEQNYSDSKEMIATRWYGKKDVRSVDLLYRSLYIIEYCGTDKAFGLSELIILIVIREWSSLSILIKTFSWSSLEVKNLFARHAPPAVTPILSIEP